MNHNKQALLDARMVKCRTCSAECFWAKTAATNQNMLVDLKPHAEGNMEIRWKSNRTLAVVLSGQNLAWAREDHNQLWRSHFVTCPQADQWRKR